MTPEILLVVLFLLLLGVVAVALWRRRSLKRRFANPDVENICRDWEEILGPRETWGTEHREMFRNIADHRTTYSTVAWLALLSLFLALPIFAQEPPAIPPVAPPDVQPAPSPSPEPTPTPTPKLWSAVFDAGPLEASTPEELKPYASVRVTVSGEPFPRWHVFAQGRGDRTSDGSAFSIDTFKTFASLEALAGFRYRIGNSPISVGAVSAVTWSRESDIKSPRDPRLWTVEGIACVERFAWWPDGGLACVGVGRRGPVGGGAVSVSVAQPIKGNVAIVVDFDLPFNKLPEFLRALPGAATSLPVGPPTAEQIRGVAQKLPISVKVGVLVRIKGLDF